MPLDFPTSPTVGIRTSIDNKIWEYNGKGWKLLPNQIQGIQGAQGLANQGVQGLAGSSQGTQGTQGVQGVQGTLGGSAGFPYQYSTTTTAADPGTGFFRFNSTTVGSITEMYISDLDTNSVDRSGALLTLDDSGGTDSARIYLPIGATGFTVSLTVTGTITNNGTWLTIPVSYTSGALPSNNELRSVIGVRNGLQGVQGVTGPVGTVKRTVGVSIDGGGSVITTGTKGYVEVPYAGTINEWKIIADVSGSATFDVWKANAAIPTNANSITAAAKPTLTAAQRATSTTLTGWTTNVAANDVFGFEVESATTITKAVLIVVIQQA
jgi:hypothetical protein